MGDNSDEKKNRVTCIFIRNLYEISKQAYMILKLCYASESVTYERKDKPEAISPFPPIIWQSIKKYSNFRISTVIEVKCPNIRVSKVMLKSQFETMFFHFYNYT